MNAICIDCHASGPWERPGSQAIRCGPCRAAYEKSRQGEYSATARLIATLPGALPYRCAICGAREDLTIDHIVPLARGGKTVLSNLRRLCRSCNSRKGKR